MNRNLFSKLKIIILFTISTIIFLTQSFSAFISFPNVTKKIKYAEILYLLNSKSFNNNFNFDTANLSCKYQDKGFYYLVSAGCFLKPVKLLKEINFMKVLKNIWEDIKGRTDIYPTGIEYKIFTGAKPIFNDKYKFRNKYYNSPAFRYIFGKLYQRGDYIRISKSDLFHFIAMNYTYYPVKRYRNGLHECFFHNYRLGIKSIDGNLLTSGKIFNLNKWLAYLPGYCKRSYENLPFYAGVCGTAGQLFRTALINPALYITKRSPHAKWRSKRYGTEVLGDDAALYNFEKVLEIKNFKYPVYFKAMYSPEIDYFVSIIPQKIGEYVVLEKKNLGGLKAVTTKKVYDKNGNLLYSQIFKSNYIEYMK